MNHDSPDDGIRSRVDVDVDKDIQHAGPCDGLHAVEGVAEERGRLAVDLQDAHGARGDPRGVLGLVGVGARGGLGRAPFYAAVVREAVQHEAEVVRSRVAEAHAEIPARVSAASRIMRIIVA